MGIALALVASVWIWGDEMVALFNSEGSSQLADYAGPGIRLYFLGFLCAVVNIIQAGFFSAIGKGLASSSIAFCRGVGAIVIFAFVLSKAFGITGVWLAFPAAEIFTFLLTILLRRRFSRNF